MARGAGLLAKVEPPEDDTGDEWGEPFDFFAGHTEAPVLGPEHVPERLWPFISDAAALKGVDPAMYALATLVTCATVIHDDWKIQPKAKDTSWIESARLWGLEIGGPSIMKTPVIAQATKPLDKLEALASGPYREAAAKHKVDLKQCIARNKRDGTTEPEPPSPKRLRYLAENATIEALGDVLRDPKDPTGKKRAARDKVMLRQDEFTEFLGNIGQYKAGGKGGDRGAYLRLYNGEPHIIDRKGEGGDIYCPHFSATILAGVQPGPLRRIATGMDDDGLMQRFMLCVSEHPGRGCDREPDHEAAAAYEGLIFSLAKRDPHYPARITLSAEAQQHREAVNDFIEGRMMLVHPAPRIVAWLGKWGGLFARLCLTFHMIEHSHVTAADMDWLFPWQVSGETAQRVRHYMIRILFPHLLRTNELIYGKEAEGPAEMVARFLLAHGKERVVPSDLREGIWDLKKADDERLRSIMGDLENAGWVRCSERQTWASVRVSWVVNPKAHAMFQVAAGAEKQRRAEAQEAIRLAGQARRGEKGV